MYKERLKDWKFTKNLKRNKALHITREAAKRQGKATEVLIGGHPVPMSRVQRSVGRHMAQAGVAPGEFHTSLWHSPMWELHDILIKRSLNSRCADTGERI